MPGVVLSLMLAAAVLPPLVDGEHVGSGWRVATLPKQTKPVTRFSAERVDERWVLRVEADRSYGNLVHELKDAGVPQRLRWRWRLQRGNPAIDLSQRSGDDLPAKVCLSFELPLDDVPFVERQILRLARSNSGEALPAATLCWVWAGHEAHEAAIDNAFTRRLRYIVLRNADDKTGTWYEESRDIAADFKRTFGDESAQVPPLSAAIVGADADNTAGHTVSDIDALRFEP